MTSLPSEIGNLINLTKLRVSFNQLTSLPVKISNLINLTTLGLNDNPIRILPDSIVINPGDAEGDYYSEFTHLP